MRKGHRRTQSAYIPGSSIQIQHSKHGPVNSHDIIRLLQASQNKVQCKVINYERLEINSLQQNNYLKFGNTTMQKINTIPTSQNKLQKKTDPLDLNCIPQNSKSSEISSKKLSKKGQKWEEDFIPLPAKKTKQKRVSDFKRLEMNRAQRNASELLKTRRPGNSLKRR